MVEKKGLEHVPWGMVMKKVWMMALATGVALSMISGSAMAQGKNVIRLEAIKVEGRIQKPQAFYIIRKSALNFESLELKQSFVPKVLKSIDKEPF